MGCGCNKGKGGRPRNNTNNLRSANNNTNNNIVPQNRGISQGVRNMDSDRRRIERLRREAIRRSFGK